MLAQMTNMMHAFGIDCALLQLQDSHQVLQAGMWALAMKDTGKVWKVPASDLDILNTSALLRDACSLHSMPLLLSRQSHAPNKVTLPAIIS